MLWAELKKWLFVREAISTSTSSYVYGVNAKPLYSGVFSPFLWQCTSYTFVYTHVREDKHMVTLTIHFVKCCIMYTKFWILKPRKYWLKSSTYYFIKHVRPLHGFGCGCGNLQMTHHGWPGSPGTQGWTMQGGAGGPFLHKEAFLRSHSHPQNASSKAPASCQVEPDTGFPESSICFWGKVWVKQADENKSVVRYQEVVKPNLASLAGWPVAWMMRPYRMQEQKGRCATLQQLSFLSISSYGWDLFSDVGCHEYPKFLFPKAHPWGNIRVPRQGWPFSSEIMEQIHIRF